MIGPGLFALPTSILGSGFIGSGFVEELQKEPNIEDAIESEGGGACSVKDRSGFVVYCEAAYRADATFVQI